MYCGVVSNNETEVHVEVNAGRLCWHRPRRCTVPLPPLACAKMSLAAGTVCVCEAVVCVYIVMVAVMA